VTVPNLPIFPSSSRPNSSATHFKTAKVLGIEIQDSGAMTVDTAFLLTRAARTEPDDLVNSRRHRFISGRGADKREILPSACGAPIQPR
jgi:hypothetical protein